MKHWTGGRGTATGEKLQRCAVESPRNGDQKHPFTRTVQQSPVRKYWNAGETTTGAISEKRVVFTWRIADELQAIHENEQQRNKDMHEESKELQDKNDEKH